MKLPPLDSVKICPKCGCRYGGTLPKELGKERWHSSPDLTWHKTLLIPFTETSRANLDPCCYEAMGGPSDDKVDIHHIYEHISRICLRCEYRWPEACWVDPEPRLSDE